MGDWDVITTYLAGDHTILSAIFQIVLLAICIYVLLRVRRERWTEVQTVDVLPQQSDPGHGP